MEMGQASDDDDDDDDNDDDGFHNHCAGCLDRTTWSQRDSTGRLPRGCWVAGPEVKTAPIHPHTPT